MIVMTSDCKWVARANAGGLRDLGNLSEEQNLEGWNQT